MSRAETRVKADDDREREHDEQDSDDGQQWTLDEIAPEPEL